MADSKASSYLISRHQWLANTLPGSEHNKLGPGGFVDHTTFDVRNSSGYTYDNDSMFTEAVPQPIGNTYFERCKALFHNFTPVSVTSKQNDAAAKWSDETKKWTIPHKAIKSILTLKDQQTGRIVLDKTTNNRVCVGIMIEAQTMPFLFDKLIDSSQNTKLLKTNETSVMTFTIETSDGKETKESQPMIKHLPSDGGSGIIAVLLPAEIVQVTLYSTHSVHIKSISLAFVREQSCFVFSPVSWPCLTNVMSKKHLNFDDASNERIMEWIEYSIHTRLGIDFLDELSKMLNATDTLTKLAVASPKAAVFYILTPVQCFVIITLLMAKHLSASNIEKWKQWIQCRIAQLK